MKKFKQFQAAGDSCVGRTGEEGHQAGGVGSQVTKFEQVWGVHITCDWPMGIPCEQTDTTENITFPHSVAGSNNLLA